MPMNTLMSVEMVGTRSERICSVSRVDLSFFKHGMMTLVINKNAHTATE